MPLRDGSAKDDTGDAGSVGLLRGKVNLEGREKFLLLLHWIMKVNPVVDRASLHGMCAALGCCGL